MWIVAVLVPASRIGRPSAGFGHENKKKRYGSVFLLLFALDIRYAMEATCCLTLELK